MFLAGCPALFICRGGGVRRGLVSGSGMCGVFDVLGRSVEHAADRHGKPFTIIGLVQEIPRVEPVGTPHGSGFWLVGIIYALINSGAIASRAFAGKKRVERGPEEFSKRIPLHKDFVTGVRQREALAGLEAAREIFRRGGIDDAVGAGRE